MREAEVEVEEEEVRWKTCGAPRADECPVLFDQVICEVGCVHGMGDNEGS